MAVVLLILCILLWLIGGLFISLFMGWSLNKVNELFKLIFWPISVFFEK